MKIRQSFVANSSSSSFIIGCHKVPTTIDEGREQFFYYGGEFVCDAVVQYMIKNLKPFKLDLDLLLELAKTKKWKDIEFAPNENATPEEEILSELCSEFSYDERYHRSGSISIWQEDRLKPMETWINAEEDKLQKKLGLANSWDVPYNKRQAIEYRWYAKKKVKEHFIQMIEWFCNDFRRYEILMYGEFDDDSPVGGEAEQGGHWKKVSTFRRFSHH